MFEWVRNSIVYLKKKQQQIKELLLIDLFDWMHQKKDSKKTVLISILCVSILSVLEQF